MRIKHEDALQKIEEQIGHTKIIDADPTNGYKTSIQNGLRNIYNAGRMDKRLYRQLYPSDAIAPRMYGMIKAHKPEKNYPMRIVVSTIGSPPYNISKYLVHLIQPTLEKNDIRIKNSSTFVNIAKSWNISPDEIQCSFDVVNLYPSVPIDKAIIVILEMLQADIVHLSTRTKFNLNDIKKLVMLSLKKCYFKWDNKIRLLENSGPIGLSLMVVIAEGYLQRIESNAINIAINTANNVSPLSYKRYVDDSHARFRDIHQSKSFLAILNAQDEKIQYTVESESENKELNFLDTTIINTEKGYYHFKIYRKNAISNVQIKPTSSVDPKVSMGVFKGFLARAHKICSAEYLVDEIKFLIDVFVENGYHRSILEKISKSYYPNINNNIYSEDRSKFVSLPWIPGLSYKIKKVFKKVGINTIFKSSSNLKTILCSRNKSKLHKLEKPGVYHTKCNCGGNYVGETGCLCSTRQEQHKKAIFKYNWKDSALAEHKKTCQDDIDWNKTDVLSVQPNWYKRKIREALEIQCLDCGPNTLHGLNRDNGNYVTTDTWKSFFSYWKR